MNLRKTFLLLLMFAVVLAGCASPATPTPKALPPTAAATAMPVATSTPVPQAVPTITEEPQAGRGVARFVLLPEKSQASYSIDETFLNQNNKLVTAVGVTTALVGELTLDYANPAASTFGEFTVDISTLKSDSTRRDEAIRERWLESAAYPVARFVVTEVKDFPADPREGQTVQFQLAGDLTIRQVTKSVTWDVTAVLQGSQLTGTAVTQIMLVDFSIMPPTIAGILNVTDGALLTLNFTFIKE